MEAKRIRLFLDASVLFSASASRTGASREILRYAWRNRVFLVVSSMVLEEAARNLAAKRPEALPYFLVLCDTLPLEYVEPTRDEVLRMQPYTAFKDAPVIAAALKANVHSLISLDRRHMIEPRTEIERQLELKILLPGEVLALLRQQEAD